MGQSLVYNSNNYADYTERIRFLRSIGDQLLQEIHLLETNMNKRRQRNQQPFIYEITKLQSMTRKMLQLIAEINVCQYFHLVNEYFDFNDYYYKKMCLKYFQDLMQQFNNILKQKNMNRIKRNLIHDFNDNDDDNDDIDFVISR